MRAGVVGDEWWSMAPIQWCKEMQMGVWNLAFGSGRMSFMLYADSHDVHDAFTRYWNT